MSESEYVKGFVPGTPWKGPAEGQGFLTTYAYTCA